MIFKNREIDLDHLPKIETTEFQQLAKSYLQVSYIGNAIFFFVLLMGIGVFSLTIGSSRGQMLVKGLLLLWLIWAAFSFILVKKGYDIRGYILREKDIIHRRGVIFKSLTTIPFNRVQHCEINQGPIQRLFNLHTLQIFTAGGSNSDLSIPGLLGETAQQIKEFIIKKTELKEAIVSSEDQVADIKEALENDEYRP